MAPDEDHKIYGEEGRRCGHFLVVAYSMQGHINPARTLAHRLAQISGCAATLSVPISAHRRMFPASGNNSDDGEVSDGLISYLPYSDGRDDGSWPIDAEDMARRRAVNFTTLSAVVGRLAAGGRPVTAMVCTLSLPVVAEVAREQRLPLAFYWIQPATVLATYYHYFHGHDELLLQLRHHWHAAATDGENDEVTLPGLQRPLRIRDLPTFFFPEKSQDAMSELVIQSMRQLFQLMDEQEMKPVVLVNTFDALEDVALGALQPFMDVFAAGPAVPVPTPGSSSSLQAAKKKTTNASEAQIHLFQHDEKSYMEWLDLQPARSVVYLAFGSLLSYTKRQAEEVIHGLHACGQPYLWVVRREGRSEEVGLCLTEARKKAGASDDDKGGMVVEWCDQQRVLAHPSVGCFVTHCGWNSTLEAVVSGVPMVAAPAWSDQPMNACLVEEEWEVGVRAERDADGVLAGEELAGCLRLLMGGGEKAVQVRANASELKERAREAVAAAGPLETSLESFVKTMQDRGQSRK